MNRLPSAGEWHLAMALAMHSTGAAGYQQRGTEWLRARMFMLRDKGACMLGLH